VTAPHPDGYGLQTVHYSFDWDQFDSNVKAANGSDTDYIEFKEIADPNDESSTIKIPLRLQVVIKDANNSYRLFFENGEDNKTRKVHVKRVYGYDIADSQLDAQGQPPSDAKQYKNLLLDDIKNEGHYIDVEIIDKHVLEQNRGMTYSKKNWAQDINAILTEGL
jgi:hypothetical protein